MWIIQNRLKIKKANTKATNVVKRNHRGTLMTLTLAENFQICFMYPKRKKQIVIHKNCDNDRTTQEWENICKLFICKCLINMVRYSQISTVREMQVKTTRYHSQHIGKPSEKKFENHVEKSEPSNTGSIKWPSCLENHLAVTQMIKPDDPECLLEIYSRAMRTYV